MSKIASFTDSAALSQRRLLDPNAPPVAQKKKVIVTGGSGKLGRWVVREMVDHGYEVYNCEFKARLIQ
jgi:FlaA1/EpsC-like NDP-sugar epimerase